MNKKIPLEWCSAASYDTKSKLEEVRMQPECDWKYMRHEMRRRCVKCFMLSKSSELFHDSASRCSETMEQKREGLEEAAPCKISSSELSNTEWECVGTVNICTAGRGTSQLTGDKKKSLIWEKSEVRFCIWTQTHCVLSGEEINQSRCPHLCRLRSSFSPVRCL